MEVQSSTVLPGLELPPGLACPTAADEPWKIASMAAGCIPTRIAPPPGLEEAVPRFAGSLRESGKQRVQSGVLPPPGLPHNDTIADIDSTQLEPRRVSLASAFGALPPGAVSPNYKVQISGLPNKLLTEIMMEAILEQAGCDGDVAGLTMRPGKPAGTVVVAFSSIETVEQCVRHFEGRQWDPSGTKVKVNVLPSAGHHHKAEPVQRHAVASEGRLTAKAQALTPSMLDFSADAPAFIPRAVVPATGVGLAIEGKATLAGADKAGVRKAGTVISSDTSTEVGESEAEDEQDALVAVTA